MPFKHIPTHRIIEWRPDGYRFKPKTDRLMVQTNMSEQLILAWIGDRFSGYWVVAPEAIPDTLKFCFGRDKLEQYEYAPGEFIQPTISVTQDDGHPHCFIFELLHPAYEAYFHGSSWPYHVYSTKKGEGDFSRDIGGSLLAPITRRGSQAS